MRARLDYAFRVFCAIYGHEPVQTTEEAAGVDVAISYADPAPAPATLRLGNLYAARPASEPAPPPTVYARDGERTVLFHIPADGARPDWLAEIFEWISCADEYSVRERDSVGRIPFSHSYTARHHLNPRMPYAALAMQMLQSDLRELVPRAAVGPSSPAPDVNHFIIATHDVDFFPVGYGSSFWRLAKNAAISFLFEPSDSLAFRQAKAAVAMAMGGENPLDQLPQLARSETEKGIQASYYFLGRRAHRRDGNYHLHDAAVLDSMRALEQQGMEVGVHGSYTSLDGPRRLADEFAVFQRHGFGPRGSRQHWLRFTLDRMIPAIEESRALYDTSLGWSEEIGFRAGACFAFPPYDFVHERPARFLEIPMAVMEVTLRKKQHPAADLYHDISELLAASRSYGWGGVSLLWHPTAFGEGQLSAEIGELYWRLADKRVEWRDTWVSAATFLDAVAQRYRAVGLLTC